MKQKPTLIKEALNELEKLKVLSKKESSKIYKDYLYVISKEASKWK